ncbi:hypothetical protein ADEAN_000116100 [Angomonas deanei]|uniref:Uncharacterized protein n=1 Tax=Angomonas deanei TaxID=59799 RepID=A0A7G2C1S3_9TRYP|nr:hypothetical protein ADEAN_000116100 [Angomonas deanei]
MDPFAVYILVVLGIAAFLGLVIFLPIFFCGCCCANHNENQNENENSEEREPFADDDGVVYIYPANVIETQTNTYNNNNNSQNNNNYNNHHYPVVTTAQPVLLPYERREVQEGAPVECVVYGEAQYVKNDENNNEKEPY